MKLLCIRNKSNNVHATDEFVQTFHSSYNSMEIIIAIQTHAATATHSTQMKFTKVKTRPRFEISNNREKEKKL